MTMTNSPVSRCGVYCGRCLPRRILAICTASRPTTLSVASITYHFWGTSPVLAMKLDISLLAHSEHSRERDHHRVPPRRVKSLRRETVTGPASGVGRRALRGECTGQKNWRVTSSLVEEVLGGGHASRQQQ